MFNPFQAANPTALPPQKVNTPIAAPIQVAQGGMSPYTVTGQLYQVANAQGSIISSGSRGPVSL